MTWQNNVHAGGHWPLYFLLYSSPLVLILAGNSHKCLTVTQKLTQQWPLTFKLSQQETKKYSCVRGARVKRARKTSPCVLLTRVPSPFSSVSTKAYQLYTGNFASCLCYQQGRDLPSWQASWSLLLITLIKLITLAKQSEDGSIGDEEIVLYVEFTSSSEWARKIPEKRNISTVKWERQAW